jgi:hypothetical protein
VGHHVEYATHLTWAGSREKPRGSPGSRRGLHGGVATCRFMKPRAPSPGTADPRKTRMNPHANGRRRPAAHAAAGQPIHAPLAPSAGRAARRAQSVTSCPTGLSPALFRLAGHQITGPPETAPSSPRPLPEAAAYHPGGNKRSACRPPRGSRHGENSSGPPMEMRRGRLFLDAPRPEKVPENHRGRGSALPHSAGA